MAWVALTCPQCGAPLPRVALWRAVKCEACGSLVNRRESIVTRDSFRQALNRARESSGVFDAVSCGGVRYQRLESLGVGEISQVFLGRRVDPLPLLVTLKISSAAEAAAYYGREAEVARALQRLEPEGAGAFFSRLLPEAIAHGSIDNDASRQMLVLRHPTGFWGSLAALSERFGQGIDPRHAVWIWRRMIEALGFVHKHGWTHGDIRPEHALVNPQDHAVRLIGWGSARRDADQSADLSRSARVIQALLCGANGPDLPGTIPDGLRQLILRAASDEDFCRSHGAQGLDDLLRAEANAAFGPPVFVPLQL